MPDSFLHNAVFGGICLYVCEIKVAATLTRLMKKKPQLLTGLTGKESFRRASRAGGCLSVCLSVNRSVELFFPFFLLPPVAQSRFFFLSLSLIFVIKVKTGAALDLEGARRM